MQTDKKPISKPSVTVRKPNYQWMPKINSNPLSASSEKLVNNDKSEKVKGQPEKVMTWVPKSE